MDGDPAASCKKAFRVTYVCGKNSKPETCALEAEAGKGGDDGEPNNFCLLHCLSNRARTPRNVKSKEEGTRRPVERAAPTAPAIGSAEHEFHPSRLCSRVAGPFDGMSSVYAPQMFHRGLVPLLGFMF
jgi:hypothetical protein